MHTQELMLHQITFEWYDLLIAVCAWKTNYSTRRLTFTICRPGTKTIPKDLSEGLREGSDENRYSLVSVKIKFCSWSKQWKAPINMRPSDISMRSGLSNNAITSRRLWGNVSKSLSFALSTITLPFLESIVRWRRLQCNNWSKIPPETYTFK